MGRSNNQLRRTAKATGKTFVPKVARGKAKHLAQKQKAEYARQHEKVAYGKTRNKKGQVKQRMFRSGGYNASGQFGRAAGAKRMMAKKGNSGGGKKK
jgi:glutaminase